MLTVGRGEYCLLAKDEIGSPLVPFDPKKSDMKRADIGLDQHEDHNGNKAQKRLEFNLMLQKLVNELCPTLGPQGSPVGRFVLFQPVYYSCARHIKNGIHTDYLKHWWETILLHCPWLNPSITQRSIPRLVCWLTSEGCTCTYTYSEAVSPPMPMPAWLDQIGSVVMKILGWNNILPKPTACNINLYRNGDDCVGWHADDENLFGGLVGNCMIISLSLGQTRTFQLRMKNQNQDDYNPPISIALDHGDIVTMEGLVQRWYQHRVPVEPHCKNPRINLTFRWILNHHRGCPRSKHPATDLKNSRVFIPSSQAATSSSAPAATYQNSYQSETSSSKSAQPEPEQNDDNDSCSAPDAPGVVEEGDAQVNPPAVDVDDP